MWSGHDLGYVEVSSVGKRVIIQLEGMALNRTFTDKVSVNHPPLETSLQYVYVGNSFQVHRIDLLAQYLGNLTNIIKKLTEKDVANYFYKENLDFSGEKVSPTNKTILDITGIIAQFKHIIIAE